MESSQKGANFQNDLAFLDKKKRKMFKEYQLRKILVLRNKKPNGGIKWECVALLKILMDSILIQTKFQNEEINIKMKLLNFKFKSKIRIKTLKMSFKIQDLKVMRLKRYIKID